MEWRIPHKPQRAEQPPFEQPSHDANRQNRQKKREDKRGLCGRMSTTYLQGDLRGDRKDG